MEQSKIESAVEKTLTDMSMKKGSKAYRMIKECIVELVKNNYPLPGTKNFIFKELIMSIPSSKGQKLTTLQPLVDRFIQSFIIKKMRHESENEFNRIFKGKNKNPTLKVFLTDVSEAVRLKLLNEDGGQQ